MLSERDLYATARSSGLVSVSIESGGNGTIIGSGSSGAVTGGDTMDIFLAVVLMVTTKRVPQAGSSIGGSGSDGG
jgi:hypothetical protein